MDEVRYTHLRPEQFRQRLAAAPIAYLPLGTLEWHGEHLPLGSDGLQSAGVFAHLAREVGGIVLPMLFLGPDRHERRGERDYYGMDIFGHPEGEPAQLQGSAYWVAEELFAQIIEATLANLRRTGFRIVVAHGHGPSNTQFGRRMPQWAQRFDLKLFSGRRADESDGLGFMTDHAAANETSLMLALHPELVRIEALGPDLSRRPLAVGGKDPRTHASAQRGHRQLALATQHLAALLRAALAELSGPASSGGALLTD